MFFRALIFACAVLLSAGCTTGSTDLNPGDAAPSFSLKDRSGVTRSLSAWQGNVVLLNFFASWCAPCRDEMPSLEALHRSLKDKGVTVLGVAVGDTPAEVSRLADEFSLSFPILLDITGSVAHLYKTKGFPETFIIDPRGSLVLFPDLADNQPVMKITGPRHWNTPAAKERLLALLSKSHDSPAP